MNAAAPDKATMRRLNGDEATARRFLEPQGAVSTVVPHRADRAVFFNSALLHRTDRCRFPQGCLN